MNNSPSTATAPEISADQATAPERQTGWSPNLSRRRIAVGALLLVIGVLAALFAWGLPPFGGGGRDDQQRLCARAHHGGQPAGRWLSR